jgi:hypothetical protein
MAPAKFNRFVDTGKIEHDPRWQNQTVNVSEPEQVEHGIVLISGTKGDIAGFRLCNDKLDLGVIAGLFNTFYEFPYKMIPEIGYKDCDPFGTLKYCRFAHLYGTFLNKTHYTMRFRYLLFFFLPVL